MENQSSDKHRNNNPRENANIFSVLTYFYTLPTFLYGYRNDITEDDLYETFTEHKSSNLGSIAIQLWKLELDNASRQRRKPSVQRVLKKLFIWDYLLLGIGTSVLELLIKTYQAVFLGELVSCYSTSDETISGNPIYYAIGIIGLSATQITLYHPLYFGSYHLALKVRVVCSSLIYEKILKLSNAALQETTPGQIINLLSNDLSGFEYFIYASEYLWIGLPQTTVIWYFLYKEVGVTSICGVSILLFFIPIYFLVGKMSATYRLKVSLRRDERLRLMNEVIQGIRVIKMYAWEKPFSKIIKKIRNLEINLITVSHYIKEVHQCGYVIIAISVFATVTASILLGQSIHPKSVFIITILLNVLGATSAFMIPSSLALLGEVIVSLNRITNFLLCDEIQLQTHSESTKYAVTITDGTTKWDKSSAKNILTNLNMEVKSGSLVAVIGAVGCGKSTLLQMILGELPLVTGSVNIKGTMSYTSQDCWIFSATVRQNILFGCEMNESRYNNVIKCCALESDLKLFPYGDRTTVGERGASLSGGQKARICLARALYKEADVYLLDDPLSAVDTQVGKHIFQQCIQQFLANKTVILATHQLQYLKYVDRIIELDNGCIKTEGSPRELEESKSDVAKYLSQDEQTIQTSETFMIYSKDDLTSVQNMEQKEENENSGFVSCATYMGYFLASKDYLLMISNVLFCVASQIASSSSFYFLAYWIHIEQVGRVTNVEVRHDYYIYLYSGITAALILLAFFRSILSYKLTMNNSKSLHNSMFNNVVHASLKFFNASSSGPIMNRFAKDLGTIDSLLPSAINNAARTVLNILGVLVVVGIVNPWFLLPTAIMAVVFWYMRKFYLATNLNVLRVEGTVRSPLYGHVNASLQGLSTIRAFGVQKILTKEFYQHQDTHSTALYISYSTSRAFAYWLDILCFIYITFIVIFYMFYTETYETSVGLAISQAFQLIGLLQWGVRQVTDVENFMISVERALQYNSVDMERNRTSVTELKPSTLWPNIGQIIFEKVNLKYSPTDSYALKNLNFTIQPLEKIGIVGRTGAGKSSMISALFQLTEIKGAIIIDNVNIKNIGLDDVRKKMSIIPQDPIIFSGTIRSNLDPFDEFDDEVLWKALEDVRLKEIVTNLKSGLNAKITQDGSIFSVGQRQLVCLARAIVRNNKILILDEATANVDVDTDAIIQETIRKKFSNCTVLTVAHRLNTIIDSDKVLVLAAGEMVEFDHPHVLLQNKDGVFFYMVQQTDNAISDTLIAMARESYYRVMK